MKKQLLNDLDKLQRLNVISEVTSKAIKSYYQQEQLNTNSRLRVVFGILGASLIGLGIILVIAHNWDEITRPVKTILAFIPLFIGQAVSWYVVFKKREDIPWREGSATFLFFAVGACIALIAQIYNIPGNMSNYLFTWMLLSLPVIYLLKSSMTSLLYLIGISWFVGETAYWGFGDASEHYYWIMLLAVMPDYFKLIRHKPQSNFTIFHHWFILLSLVFALGVIGDKHGEWLFVVYIVFFGFLYELGTHTLFGQKSLRNNIYHIIASLGSIIVLLIVSFDWLWHSIYTETVNGIELIKASEVLFALFLLGLTAFFDIKRWRDGRLLNEFHPIQILPFLFVITFVVSYANELLPQIMANVFLLGIGVYYLMLGSRSGKLGLLNFGLLIITALAICRFFDTEISFVMRGMMFIVVGIGFFAGNYRIIKKRQNNEV